MKVIIGTLALCLVAKFLTSNFASRRGAKPSKKWVYRCIKLGQTHIKSISLLLERRSST